ncbi:MAG: RHS repeat domain-containing protein [Desulfovibrionaceae bacterium]
MDGKRIWAVFADGRVRELDAGRPVPRNFPAEWGDFFVTRSDIRPEGGRPEGPGPLISSRDPGCVSGVGMGAGVDARPGDGHAAGAGMRFAGRYAGAPDGAAPYALRLVRREVPIARTDRPSHHPGRPDRRVSRRTEWTERIARREERTPRGAETREFQYDDAGRLARVRYDGGLAESYQYDARGRREWALGRRGHSDRRYVYGPDNRLLMVRSGLSCTSYEHDAAGFRSAKVEMGVPGAKLLERTTRYRYAPDGRLLAVLLPDGRSVEYAHDQHGRRAEKRINGRTVETYEWLDRVRLSRAVCDGARLDFLYSGGRLPDTMLRDGRTYRLHYDQVGTLRVVVDESGNAVKELACDSFGNILEDTNPAFRVPLGFAGGLYDPDTGRFTALDPLGDAGGDSDWYGYCLDDPVNLVDPEGMAGEQEKSIWDWLIPSAEEASLTTDMDNNSTTFDPRPEDSDGEPFTIETRNQVTSDSDSDAGANAPFSTDDVQVINHTETPKSFGPDGAYIDTGDSRGRDIHGGGGSGVEQATRPRQGWRKTKGCTRGQNEDVMEMGRQIKDFQKRHPGVKIPYSRFHSDD